MAISATHYTILKNLRDQKLLPQSGRIVEIGKANWYGDAPPSLVDPDLPADAESFAVARKVYETLFNSTDITAIDLDPNAEGALRFDLNDPGLSFQGHTFDVAINHGTAEHIFNIGNVFRLMHDLTYEGGLMIHESPFTGWLDHGFYCLQPTLFYDVAAANGYEVVRVACEHLTSRSAFYVNSREELHAMKQQGRLADNLMLFVVLRKTTDAPFRVPMQGVYAGTVSQDVANAWRELR